MTLWPVAVWGSVMNVFVVDTSGVSVNDVVATEGGGNGMEDVGAGGGGQSIEEREEQE